MSELTLSAAPSDVTPRRVLVFGINYAPEPTSTGVLTTCLAEGLSNRDWDVTVVTGVPHYPWWRAQPIPRMESLTPRLIRRRHYVPASQSALRRGAFELSWFASALPTLVARRPLDLVLGVSPNLGGAALAVAAAARYRIPCALLVQDVVARAAEQSGIEGANRVVGPVRRVEAALARRADGVAIVAEGFRDYFLENGVSPSRIFRVRNPARFGVPSESRESTRARLGWSESFVVLHSGNIGYKQHLENVLDAAAIARDDRTLRFVLQGDGNQRERLEQMAQELQLPNLEFLPVATDGEFASILRAADVLLLNQRGSVRNMSLPGKLGSYFAAGIPVVAAVSSEDETADEIRAARAGVVVEPEAPTRLLEEISVLRSDPARARELGEAGRSYAERYLTGAAALQETIDFLEACISRATCDANRRRTGAAPGDRTRDAARTASTSDLRRR